MEHLDKLQQLVLYTFVIVIPMSVLVWASLQVPPSGDDDTDDTKGP